MKHICFQFRYVWLNCHEESVSDPMVAPPFVVGLCFLTDEGNTAARDQQWRLRSDVFAVNEMALSKDVGSVVQGHTSALSVAHTAADRLALSSGLESGEQ